MKTAAAYLRLSYKQVNGVMVEEDRDGIARQRKDLKALAKQNGAELPDSAIFFEDDTSGSKKRGSKTEWAKLLKLVVDSKPDLLLGTAADRLGRRLADIEGLEELTRKTGTKVLTLKEQDLFSSSAWPFIAAQAKSESMNTAIRVRRAQDARRAVGKDSAGGSRPYGYKADRLTVVEKEAEIIREVVRRVSKGEAINAITADLNRRKIPTVTKGKEWSTITVRRMVQNPRYAGYNLYKGEVIGKGAWEPIISTAEHEAVKRALETVSKPVEGRPSSSLLGGIVRCGVCGQTMNSTRSGRVHKIYRCSGNQGGKAGCGRTSRGRDLVDAWVTDQILSTIDESVIEVERRAMHVQMNENGEQEVAIEIQIHDVQEAYAERRLGAEDYFATLDMLRKRQQQRKKDWGVLAQAYEELTSGLEARTRWNSWTLEEKRAYIRSRLVAVVVNKFDIWGAATVPIQEGELEILWRDNPLSVPLDPNYVEPTITEAENQQYLDWQAEPAQQRARARRKARA